MNIQTINPACVTRIPLHRYITGKALSVVMAEIELEDTQTGNRTDSFYPIWARAEHRWYPSGRFAAYNEYVKDNLPDLTVKPAPGVSLGSSVARAHGGLS